MAWQKHAHCGYCGVAFAEGQPWPRACAGCGQVSYLNPVPVAVLLLPVDGGLLCVRRAIEPGRGKLALPGGFMDVGETWQEACARELEEEAGVRIDPGEVGLFAVHTVVGQGLVLVFGKGRERGAGELPEFRPTEEASEAVVVREAIELAFPTHTAVMKEYFEGRKG
jgi:ADP-ribose pyrophosphatase YjhB (NUDIX family)